MYIVRRLIYMAFLMLGVLALTFVITRAIPSSPVELMLGAKPTAEQIEQARQSLGLDQPLIVQFGVFLGNLFQGDLGVSLRTGQPVLGDVLQRFAATAELVFVALLLAASVGIPGGVLAATRRGKLDAILVRTAAVLSVAVPIFFLGIVLQMLLHGGLGWFPLQGRLDVNTLIDAPFEIRTGFYLIDTLIAGNLTAWQSALSHIALPALTLAIATSALLFRVTRSLMLDVLSAEHLRTFEAYGVPKSRIHYRYALRATLIPLLTIVGLTAGYLLGGSVIVEYVFDWPGIGGYMVEAVIANDLPAVMGGTLLLAFTYLTINLLIDLLYYAADPRLRA
ncbi:MAG: ABC transporter permease [Pseudomonadota bacterium]